MKKNQKKRVKIGVLGQSGRMGKAIQGELEQDTRFELVAKAGSRDSAVDVFILSDVVIDFTTPQALETHIELAKIHHKPLMIGTTGLNDTLMSHLKKACATISCFYAENTSFSMACFKKITHDLACILAPKEYDIAIHEIHHRDKKDSPSGTALSLQKAAILGCQKSGYSEKDIGVCANRGGGVFGEHTVRFLGTHDVITLTHQGLSRALFAKGALDAAWWLYNEKKNSPGFYGMEDMIESKT